MASRAAYYDVDQIMYSFLRYRGDHIYDKTSFQDQFDKHFNTKLRHKVGDQLWDKRELQTRLKGNREMLEKSGKLPKWERSAKELEGLKKIRKWRIGLEKGRKVRTHATRITWRGKSVRRYRDAYGRFTSRPIAD
jgi:hypothetical protein